MLKHAPESQPAAQHDTTRQTGIAPARVARLSAQDNWPVALVQRQMAAAINASPKLMRQRALANSIHHSPRMQAAQARVAQLIGANHTGLPDQLKAGVESLSGMSMDHVKVHYNSAKPAQLNAHAYAQGSEIHVGPGQQQHLPHEAWHVVQQAQNRVKPTLQMKDNIPLNDDQTLEREADVMGAKALGLGESQGAMARGGMSAITQFAGTRADNAMTTGGNKIRARVQLMHADVIQRDVNLTVGGGGLITVVTVNRLNELGIFGDHQGDHTTAHVVFRDMIRNQLLGLTLAAAPARLQTLFDQISNLPGMFTNAYVIDDHRTQVLAMSQAAQDAIDTANTTPTQANIEAAAQAVLNFRNAVPMSAVHEGGVGGGEGPQSARLRLAEDRLRANPAFDLNTLAGALPFNDDGSVREQLAEAVMRLLDVSAVNHNLELAHDRVADGEDAEYEFSPGFAGIQDADTRDILIQHLTSIRMAYPLLWAAYLQGVLADLIPDLAERIANGSHQDEEYEDDDF